MKQAKPTPADLEAFEVLFRQLQSISNEALPPRSDGIYPDRDEETDEPKEMSLDDPDDCYTALNRVMAHLREHPAMLPRILGTISAVFYNDVFDPEKKELAWHPDFLEVVDRRQKTKVLAWAEKHVHELPKIVWRRRDGDAFSNAFGGYAPRHYHTGAPEKGWVLSYSEGGGDITFPEIPPEEGMQPVRYQNEAGEAGWYWLNLSREVPYHA